MKKAKKGPFWARVCEHKQTGKTFYKLSLELSGEGAKTFSQTRPGQFVEIDLSTIALPPIEAIPEEFVQRSRRGILLRRPFSFCDVTAKKNKTVAEILYGVVGPASLRMTTLKVGDRVNVIGPLGNGFSIPKGKKAALLVSGGMGCPPLLHLLNFIARDYPAIKVTVFAGAKSKEDLPCSELAKGNLGREKKGKKPAEQLVTTEDGSAGTKGLVTELVEKWLDKSGYNAKDIIIYGCGPEAMLSQVARISNERTIDCQVSMERMMACGIGVCQTCAIECRLPGSSKTIYKLCCKDGPVFDVKEIVFSL